jgi:hypothetical protein
MQFLITIILSTVGIAPFTTGAPAAEGNIYKSHSKIEKRHLETSNCGLDNYPKIGQRATLAGFNIWQNIDIDSYNEPNPDVIVGKLGWCTLSWCGGEGDMSVGFYLCLNEPGPKDNCIQTTYSPKVLGKQLADLYTDCYGSSPADEKRHAPAAQYWGEGYNLLMAGNATCSDKDQALFRTNG